MPRCISCQKKLLCEDCGAVIEQPTPAIDCDVAPFVPSGYTVESHKKGGQFVWDASKVELYLDDEQRKSFIRGTELLEKLEGEKVLNANVLDYLLKNPHLIPEEWKGKYIFFWGTVYRHAGGSLYVRYLRWDGSSWYWDYRWLGSAWNASSPAALAS